MSNHAKHDTYNKFAPWAVLAAVAAGWAAKSGELAQRAELDRLLAHLARRNELVPNERGNVHSAAARTMTNNLRYFLMTTGLARESSIS